MQNMGAKKGEKNRWENFFKQIVQYRYEPNEFDTQIKCK